MTSPKIVLDTQRENRIGVDEAILCAQKTVAQIERIVAMSDGSRRLFTRLSAEKYAQLPEDIRRKLSYEEEARIAVLGTPHPQDKRARIAIISAGSSDAPTVAEARETLKYYGQPSVVNSDVGIADHVETHRPRIGSAPVPWLLGELDAIFRCPAVDLSRFDAAPLIAFTATKELNYGTETDG